MLPAPTSPSSDPAPVRAWVVPGEGSGRGLSAPVGPLGSFRDLAIPSGSLTNHPSRHCCSPSDRQGPQSKQAPMLSLRGSVSPKASISAGHISRKWVRLAPRASSRLLPVPPAASTSIRRSPLRLRWSLPRPIARCRSIFPKTASGKGDPFARVAPADSRSPCLWITGISWIKGRWTQIRLGKAFFTLCAIVRCEGASVQRSDRRPVSGPFLFDDRLSPDHLETHP